MSRETNLRNLIMKFRDIIGLGVNFALFCFKINRYLHFEMRNLWLKPILNSFNLYVATISDITEEGLKIILGESCE